MDYSSLQSDSENLAASSPWATSPQRSKSGFEHHAPTASDDVSLPSPTIGAQQASQTRPHDQLSSLPQDEDRTASKTFGAENGHRDGLVNRTQERYQQQSPPNTSNGPRSAQHRDTAGKMPARPTPPQYKLQAKINGLERSGRKDPILRFDVYVQRLISIGSLGCRLTLAIDQSPWVPHNTVSRCATNTWRIWQASRPPCVCQP